MIYSVYFSPLKSCTIMIQLCNITPQSSNLNFNVFGISIVSKKNDLPFHFHTFLKVSSWFHPGVLLLSSVKFYTIFSSSRLQWARTSFHSVVQASFYVLNKVRGALTFLKKLSRDLLALPFRNNSCLYLNKKNKFALIYHHNVQNVQLKRMPLHNIFINYFYFSLFFLLLLLNSLIFDTSFYFKLQ
jgi:hypothetical protein